MDQATTTSQWNVMHANECHDARWRHNTKPHEMITLIALKTWFQNRKGSKYGKGYIRGITTSPTLQEDLDPISRTERSPEIRNGGDPRAPKWPLY